MLAAPLMTADGMSEPGVTRSRGAVGTSADYAAAESQNATVKRETLQGRKRWNGASEARLAVFRSTTRHNTSLPAVKALRRAEPKLSLLVAVRLQREAVAHPE